MKRRRQSLLSLFGLGGPSILGLSSGLTGAQEGRKKDGQEIRYQVADVQVIDELLEGAQREILAGNLGNARTFLKAADTISSKLLAHTELFDTLLSRKTTLWEQLRGRESK